MELPQDKQPQNTPNAAFCATDIHSAAGRGDIDFVKNYMKNGGDVNLLDKNGASPLGIALAAEHFELARELLLNGASVDAQDVQLSSYLDNLFPISFGTVDAILKEDLDKIVRFVKQSNSNVFSWRAALQIAVTQGRVLATASVLSLETMSLNTLAAVLLTLHRILRTATLSNDQRARYEAIRDLLIVHGSRLQVTTPVPVQTPPTTIASSRGFATNTAFQNHSINAMRSSFN